MSRATALWILLASVLAGGCSGIMPSATPRPTQWFAQEEPVAQLPADDASTHTFAFAGKYRIRTATFSTGASPELLRVDDAKAPLAQSVQNIFFSPDGFNYAYAGQLRNQHVAVVDGQSRPGPDARPEMTMSEDSHHLAYIAAVGKIDCAVIDGQPQPVPGMAIGAVSLSSNGAHWACAAADRSKPGVEYMVIDGLRGPAYDQILSYRYQGDRLYYTASRDKNRYMVGPTGQSQPHEAVSDIFISPNGSHVGWVVTDAQKKTLIVQFRNILAHFPLSDDATVLAITNQGHAICATGTKDDYKVTTLLGGFVGKKEFPVDGAPIAAVADPCGQHVAAIVVNDRGQNLAQGLTQPTRTQHVELDGQKQPDYLLVRGLTFSPRGTHLAYWGMRPDQRWALVVDGRQTLVFDSVPLAENGHWSAPVTSPAPITFSDDNAIKAIGINGRTVSRVTLSAQEAQ